MNVLVACEESQRVCSAFRAKGHNAFSCDILPCSGGHPEWHIQGNVLKFLNPRGFVVFDTQDGKKHTLLIKHWDLIIAHPPCTFLTKAGARWLYHPKGILDERRHRKGLEAKEFFLKLLNADCPRVVVENPIPMKIFDLPEPTQAIQPYQFDEFGEHPYTKLTYLWIKGESPLEPTTPDEVPLGPWCPSGTSRKKRGASYGAAPRGDDAKNRSKTPVGIAKAMSDQWG